MARKKTTEELKALSREERVKSLTELEKNVFDLLVRMPSLRETKYELVYHHWLENVRFKNPKSIGNFEIDFINGLVQCESINRCQRHCKALFPELGPTKNKEVWSDAAEVHLEKARRKTNPAQGDLF